MANIRYAAEADLAAMVALIEQRRFEYEQYEPVFWKKASDSAEKTEPFFKSLLTNERATALVAYDDEQLVGFLIAINTPAPPVYEPGGTTILVDDFCVADASLWPSVGRSLLDQLEVIGREAGWRQYVVVSGKADQSKSEFLTSTHLSLASTWWTTTF